MQSPDRRSFIKLLSTGAAAVALRESIGRALGFAGEQQDRNDQRYRAYRRADAGEPLLRSLFRHAAGRPRLWRSARDASSDRQSGVLPAGRRRLCAAVPSDRARPRAAVHPGPRARLGYHPRRLEPGQLGPVGAEQGAPRRWPISTAATFRSTTRWPTPSPSATPTTARCSVRPIRTATTCGPAGSATTATAAARWWTMPRRATTGRPIRSACRRAGSPGRSTRMPAPA